MNFVFYIIFFCFCCSINAQKKIHHLSELSTNLDFQTIKGSPNTNKFVEVDAVKVIYDIKNDSLYFMNSNLYDYHFSFCVRYLGYKFGKKKFDHDNYNSVNNRDYLMGTINRFYKNGLFTLEFSVADNITVDQIRLLYNKIIEKFNLSGLFKLFLNTNNIRSKCRYILDIPTIDVDEIYIGQSFQSLNQNSTYGFLRFLDIDSLENLKNIKKHDIVILNGIPNVVPPVSALISSDFQTPLSHLTILCQNRGTPFMALKNVWRDSLFRSLENSPVFLEILKDTFFIKKTNKNIVNNYWIEKTKKMEPIKLTVNGNIKSIIPIKKINKNSTSFAGSKASNFGMLFDLKRDLKLNVKIPECAFVIPFYFYKNHIESNKIDILIEELLLNKKEYIEQGVVETYLENIRTLIIKSEIDSFLIKDVESEVRKCSFNNIRFRSSTNAEDLEGFNGAGLYDSKTGILDNKEKSFEIAIKTVWASTWNYRAFMEREYFGIDQNSVAMGILCHRSFPNEKANGVIITKNLYRDNSRGFVINTQYGEIGVVNPPLGINCEQLICYSDLRYKNDSFYGKKNIVEYLSYSNILPDSIETVLTSSEVNQITREVAKIKKKLYNNFKKNNKKMTYHQYGLDLEFKIYGKERNIYLKQIRPFKN